MTSLLFDLLKQKNFLGFVSEIRRGKEIDPSLLEQVNEDGDSFLFQASACGVLFVNACLKFGMRPDEALGVRGDNAFTWCARDGLPESFFALGEWALANSVNMHAANTDGNTPLMIAASYGDIRMLKAVLSFCPNLNARDLDQETIFEQLARDKVNERENIKDILVEHLTRNTLLAISKSGRSEP